MPPVNRHQPARAWLIGAGYFAACWIVAVGARATAGVVNLFEDGAARPARFWVIWLVALGAAYVGYWVIWPKGTYTGGRPLHVVSAGVFGMFHGVSEGILYVAIWVTLSRWLTDPLALVVVTVAGIGIFNGVWRTFVWDVWVTPPHNVESWNTRKVLFVHLPVLTIAVAHLTAFESVAAFLSIQVVALVGAAVRMHFPSPFRAAG